ncbi:hypothetical protein MAMC_02072 [Methylacidimicrobium cyclopophantes]|uniref:Uncharacterized protein n=1 Tax=Methylacidimicrobium cyclopophantes TaxID=1041766 RepID=A0A5E6MGX7_9BACT|nr:hypothetical protein MAMC_02072 [Methylacidimicrobium cyclopophantes]
MERFDRSHWIDRKSAQMPIGKENGSARRSFQNHLDCLKAKSVSMDSPWPIPFVMRSPQKGAMGFGWLVPSP